MARTVVAIYDDFQTANDAVRELVDNNFSRDNISIIANNARGEYAFDGATSPAETVNTTRGENVAGETGTGAGVGAGIGAAIGGIGGLLIGLGALTIPGIGPVIAAGPLAVALSTLTGAGVGAVAGGVTGGLLGALIGLGIPEEEAEFYAEGIRRGGVLVTVQTDDARTDSVLAVLNRHNPIDIKQRAAQWREQGWTGYDDNADKTHSFKTPDMALGSVPTTGGMVEPPVALRPVEQPADTWEVTDEEVAEFNEENPSLRNHYNTYLSNTGYPFDYYVPAYRYGYGLASDARYQNSTWSVAEPDLKHNWELEHPGTWDRFKNAIRYAWEDTSGMGRGPNDPISRP